MDFVRDFIIKKQPVMVSGVVTWLTTTGAAYGLHLDAKGVVLLTTGVGFVVSWLARSVVWSQHTLDQEQP